MNKQEFLDAMKEVNPTLEVVLTSAGWGAITACYVSKRLDPICSGPDRHLQFARWFNANKYKVNRLAGWYNRQIMRVNKVQELENLKADVERLQAEVDSFPQHLI